MQYQIKFYKTELSVLMGIIGEWSMRVTPTLLIMPIYDSQPLWEVTLSPNIFVGEEGLKLLVNVLSKKTGWADRFLLI